MKNTAQRAIPADSTERNFPGAGLVFYTYESARGPALRGFKGRQSKVLYSLVFGSDAHRESHITHLVKEHTEREAYKRARREAGHGLAVGDVVYESFGYEQTSVTFFQVVRVPSPRSAVVREVEQVATSDGPRSMTGRVVPTLSAFKTGAAEQTRRAAGLHVLNGRSASRGDLAKWDGKPKRFSSYG